MPTIMIVDDQRSIANLWARGFKQIGYEVRVAYGAIEAGRDINQNGLPDVIILDQIMTYGGGVDLVRDMETYDPDRNVPIILVTAEPNVYFEELVDRVSAIVQKPVLFRDLLARVEYVLEESRGTAGAS